MPTAVLDKGRTDKVISDAIKKGDKALENDKLSDRVTKVGQSVLSDIRAGRYGKVIHEK